MPRLAPRFFHQARKIDSLLPYILCTTRDIESAQNELRWLKVHALSEAQQQRSSTNTGAVAPGWRHTLRRLCHDRSRGKPLQYLIGTEYFGDLEIICRPGVLIPRQETAASVTHLVRRLAHLPPRLRVLDLCTGTGCIPLLFQHEIRQSRTQCTDLEVLGIDLSPKAISLANLNLRRQQEESRDHVPVTFAQADVLAEEELGKANSVLPLATVLKVYNGNTQPSEWDVLISNPPYISPAAFNSTTTRSVRNYEPRLALVPEKQHLRDGLDPGDIFYPRLLDIAEKVNSKVVLFEVADLDQAQRVALMVQRRGTWDGVEIWRDDPDDNSQDVDGSAVSSGRSSDVKVIGSGNGRSVFAWRSEARD